MHLHALDGIGALRRILVRRELRLLAGTREHTGPAGV